MWRLRRRALSHCQSRCLPRVCCQNYTLELSTVVYALVPVHDHDKKKAFVEECVCPQGVER